ncbi:hypothetical protein MP638_005635 [Amoeboaphelidium occidentale]|nr:hypothetical protein MP638_005635 [Amoeboaphelidium occidentale]
MEEAFNAASRKSSDPGAYFDINEMHRAAEEALSSDARLMLAVEELELVQKRREALLSEMDAIREELFVLEKTIDVKLAEKRLPPLPQSPDSGIALDENACNSNENSILSSKSNGSIKVDVECSKGDNIANMAQEIDRSQSSPLGIALQRSLSQSPKITHKLSKAEEEFLRVIQAGKRRFNISPEKGIKYLRENKFFENDPPHAEDIARFLFTDNGMLSKKIIGEYLGAPENTAVLEAFVDRFSFNMLSLEGALRQFLRAFRLPGEAQKIDRMMTCFASKFIECNPADDFFKDTDTAYIMAFSMIMLNTDLHNPAVKNKISKEAFVRNNLDVLLREEAPLGLAPAVGAPRLIPTAYLEDVYDALAKRPFDMIASDDEHENLAFFTFFNPEREGWLMKQGGRIKTWKRRFCLLTGSCLYYFKSEITSQELNGNDSTKRCQQPCGIIPLENLSVAPIEPHEVPGGSSGSKRRYYFKLYTVEDDKCKIKAAKTSSDGKIVQGKHSEYVFSTETEGERLDWIHSIEGQMANPPLYALYAEKKRKKVGSSTSTSRDRNSFIMDTNEVNE